MPWIKLSLTVSQNKLARIEEALFCQDVQSLVMTSAVNETHLEDTLHELPEWSHVRVEAMFALDDNIQTVLTSLHSLGMEGFDVSFVGDQYWQQAGTQLAKPLDFGGLQVVPRRHPTTQTKNLVRIEPGLAFGTGHHPTTSMCLTWLAQHPPQDTNVLDFGTGSGILGIAARILGARSVDAVDTDLLARETARENARYNEAEISVMEHIPTGSSYDLIVTNILLNTILQFAPTLTASLNLGGTILLTGLLPCQLDRVHSVYSEIQFEETIEVEDWCLLVGKKVSDQ